MLSNFFTTASIAVKTVSMSSLVAILDDFSFKSSFVTNLLNCSGVNDMFFV